MSDCPLRPTGHNGHSLGRSGQAARRRADIRAYELRTQAPRSTICTANGKRSRRPARTAGQGNRSRRPASKRPASRQPASGEHPLVPGAAAPALATTNGSGRGAVSGRQGKRPPNRSPASPRWRRTPCARRESWSEQRRPASATEGTTRPGGSRSHRPAAPRSSHLVVSRQRREGQAPGASRST
jgi:hypothetical protein